MKLRLMICAAAASTALFATEDANSATYAVMNVTNAYTDTVIAVPWVGLDGTAITISNLVNTTTLTAGDKLYMYNDDGTWYEYTKSAGGVWTGAETITPTGTHSAESQVVQRGTGLVLQRAESGAGGTVLLAGRVDSGTITTTIAANGKTLFANPTTDAVAITNKFTGATLGDTITIPLNNGSTDIYTFNGSEWGKTTRVSYQRKIGNTTRTSYSNVWETCTSSIPAGTGAWYDSKANSDRTISW